MGSYVPPKAVEVKTQPVEEDMDWKRFNAQTLNNRSRDSLVWLCYLLLSQYQVHKGMHFLDGLKSFATCNHCKHWPDSRIRNNTFHIDLYGIYRRNYSLACLRIPVRSGFLSSSDRSGLWCNNIRRSGWKKKLLVKCSRFHTLCVLKHKNPYFLRIKCFLQWFISNSYVGISKIKSVLQS